MLAVILPLLNGGKEDNRFCFTLYDDGDYDAEEGQSLGREAFHHINNPLAIISMRLYTSEKKEQLALLLR